MNHIPTMSLLFCLSFVAQVAAEPFELKDGDRVVLLGSEFVAQQMRHNYFEAALATTWPDRRVTVRNLGWSGDTPSMASRGYFEHAKQEGWNRTVAELTRLKPTVVFLFYGSNSPFGTEGQKAQFLTEMNRLVTEVQKLTSRIVIVSPPPARESPLSLPAPPDLNADREAVAAALEEFATERELRFVDLFKPLQTTLASAKAPLMYDALRYNAAGYRAAADVLLKSLAVKPPKLDANRSAELRQLIARKNELYFRRYRPQNETYLRGFRKHEQGRNAKEIIEFDALIAQAESRIAAFVEGKPLPPAMKEPDPIKLAFTAMTPEQQLKQMTVAERFELSLFAAEPMVANPIHMQFDARGRLWVATSPIYPHIKPGAKPRDEIVILEDTDGDGRADKRTVFADDLLIPTAVLPDERGGAFVANSTEILHLSDTDGDGRADQRRMVLSGFGSEDTHHILHTFRWGPDAAFYFNQSIYIHTHMETPYGVRRLMGSGIWRYRPETGHAEIMMRGLVNPWGHVFDEWGQSFATDGAGGDGINYIFPHSVHVTAVGFSRNLRGLNPGQPKHCGLEVIQSRHFPDDWQGALITSDFRGNRINSFRLSEQGSGYGSRQSQDLVTSKHGAFRPVDMKIGPDGALYIADWYNPIIQHGEVDFRDARRDYKHGRIWRLTAKDRPLLKKPKLADATVPELLEHLKAPEHWTRRRAKVQLTLRDRTEVVAALKQWTAELDPANPNFEHDRLEALWASQAVYHIDVDLLKAVLASPDPRARAAAVRVLSHWRGSVDETLSLLAKATQDSHPRVRREAVSALHTFGTAEAAEIATAVLAQPMDPLLDFALWSAARGLQEKWLAAFLAGEATFGGDAQRLAFALKAAERPEAIGPLADLLKGDTLRGARRADVMRLIGQLGKPEHLALVFDLAINNKRDRGVALGALVIAARRKVQPAGDLNRIENLLGDPDAVRLVGLWAMKDHQPKLQQIAMAKETPTQLRVGALEGLAALGDQETLAALADTKYPLATRRDAVTSLVSISLPRAAGSAAAWLVDAKDADQANVEALVAAFTTRKQGPEQLAAALQGKTLDPHIATVAVRAAGSSGPRGDALVAALRSAGGLSAIAKKLTPAEVKALLAEVQTQGDPVRGETIYRRRSLACVTCHSIAGGGGRVGPDMVSLGAGSPADYIVESLLVPSAKIKEGYHTTNIATDAGRIFNGTVISDGQNEIVLRDAQNVEHLIKTADIDEQTISNKSMMPDDLVAKLPRDEFVDLVAFLSQLGKDGPFKAPANRFARMWKLADGSLQVSCVDGSLPVADVVGGKASITINVTAAGPIGLDVHEADSVRVTRGTATENLRGRRMIVDLPVGRHAFHLQVLDNRTAPLKVEVVDVPGSSGRAEPVNQ